MQHDPAQAERPTTLVLFGSTGDLARREVLPALCNLFCENEVPKSFRIIGFASDNEILTYLQSFVGRAIEFVQELVKEDVRAGLLTTEYAQ